jgi:hypothetical protein
VAEIKGLPLYVQIRFCGLNGFRLAIDDENEQEYLRKLLLEVQEERSKLNDDVMAKIILYVSKRIRKI